VIDAKTRADLGWDQLLEYLASRAASARGKDAVLALAPLPDLSAATERIAEVTETRALLSAGEPLAFGGIEDVAVSLARADKGGALESEALLAVARTGRGCFRLRQHLETHQHIAPLLRELAQNIDDLGHVFHPILESFDADGRIADHASDRLADLRKNAARLRSRLEKTARELVEDSRLSAHLQDKFWTQRDDRYVLPIKVESRSIVRGIVHGTSGSGQTVFVEPEEMVDLNNQLKLAECEVADEEQRILEQLTSYVAEEAESFRRATTVAIHLDVVAACGRFAHELDATAPVLEDGGAVELAAARHPLMILSGRDCVPNDLLVSPGTILVVSGPNAGGKTVALKTLGLAAIMARAGLHILAADGSRIPWFDRVCTDIGDSQSLENDLSTFSAHLLGLRRFLEQADERTLLLIDEVAVGTDPDQGAALAQAVLETLAERRVCGVVTTHYEPLKALAAADARFANASVGFDYENLAPTFRLHMGVPGGSGALLVARRLGLDEAIVARAQQLLGAGRAQIEELLATLANTQKQLDAERAELATAKAKAEQATAAAELARKRAKERERDAHQRAHNDAVAALRDARVELDRIRSAVKKRSSTGADENRIDQLSRSISENEPHREPVAGRPATEADLSPGAHVIVRSLGDRGRGEVVAAPDRGRVTVQVGPLRTTVSIGDVLLAPVRAARPANKPPLSSPAQTVDLVAADDEGRTTVRTPDSTLDVRGERVDEALDAVDRFVDRSLLAERDLMWIIHGHGTGALRRAVRDHLSSHPSIRKLRAGIANEGGDGVTVAWLEV